MSYEKEPSPFPGYILIAHTNALRYDRLLSQINPVEDKMWSSGSEKLDTVPGLTFLQA